MMISQGDKFRPVTITLSSKEDVDNFLEIIRFNNNRRPESLRKFAKKIIQWFDANSNGSTKGEAGNNLTPDCTPQAGDIRSGESVFDFSQEFSSLFGQTGHKLKPTYFVAHPDGSFSVADPQPEEIEGSKLKDQLNSLYQALREAQITIRRSPLEPK